MHAKFEEHWHEISNTEPFMNILTARCARRRVTVLHTGTIAQHYSVTEDFRNILRLFVGFFLFLLFCWYVNRLRAQVSQNYHSESEYADTEIAALISSVILTWVLMNAVTGQQEETDSTQRPYLLVIMLRRINAGGTLSDTAIRPSVCLSVPAA